MKLPQVEVRRAEPARAKPELVPTEPHAGRSLRPTLSARKHNRATDSIFRIAILFCALSIIAIVALFVYELTHRSWQSIEKFGLGFLTGRVWDPVFGNFGAAPFIYGTIVSAAIALLLAVPLSLGTAIFVTEMCPKFLRGPISYMVELLAAIPSVIYGLWAIFILAPLLRSHVQPFLAQYFGWTGLFDGPMYGVGMLAAGVVLAIMIVPFISAITREVMEAVPQSQREATLALGATRWEMIRTGVLRNARAGIFGGVILGLGRAMGETMAVTMVIGNRAEIAKSLFAPGYTMASVIANEFAEADSNLYLSALVEIGLVLFVVTFLLNMAARFLIWTITRGTPKGGLHA